MIKKISALLLIIICVFCLTGCNNETEEERLQREIKELEQSTNFFYHIIFFSLLAV